MKTQKQNEPQLSAEMEKRFDEFVADPSNWDDSAGLDVDTTKHFLATALEEQRAEILNEVESWLNEFQLIYGAFSSETGDWQGWRIAKNEESADVLLTQLLAKLAQMKGKDSTSLKKPSVDDLVPDSMKEDW